MLKMGWPSATETLTALFLLGGVYIPACWFAIRAVLRKFSPTRFAKNTLLHHILFFLLVVASVPYLAIKGWSAYTLVAEEWRGYKYYRYVLLLQNMPKYIAQNTNFSDVQLCRENYILINSPPPAKEFRKTTVETLCDIAMKKVLNSKYSEHYVNFVIWDNPKCAKRYYDLEYTAPEALRIMCFNSGAPMVSGGEKD